ncbi:MAG TPA: crosslink repair DNA glycosylase YcaQ family protein [Microlunatus sp.]
MRRWSEDDLRLSTLRRQFPERLEASARPTPAAVLDLVDRIAPIQSQVPRAPFATIAARLPGAAYADLVDLFESHQLVKASTLRGTVFTSGREQFGWSQRIAREGRVEFLASQTKVPAEEARALLAAVEARAADWLPWDDLVAYARELMLAGSPDLALRVDQVRFLLWGQAGLLRRPPDSAWQKRTDILRRSARIALPDLPESTFDEAVLAMVERHLRAYGPVTSDDLCFYLGIRKTPLRRALATLADRVIRGEGPEGQPMLDLDDEFSTTTELPGSGSGIRLLAEFDGLLMGYAGPGRLRFLEPEQLALVWNAKNAVCAPTVLSDGRIVARWKTVGTGRRVRLEVTMLPPHRPLPAAVFAPAASSLETALDLEVRDVRVSEWPRGADSSRGA